MLGRQPRNTPIASRETSSKSRKIGPNPCTEISCTIWPSSRSTERIETGTCPHIEIRVRTPLDSLAGAGPGPQIGARQHCEQIGHRRPDHRSAGDRPAILTLSSGVSVGTWGGARFAPALSRSRSQSGRRRALKVIPMLLFRRPRAPTEQVTRKATGGFGSSRPSCANSQTPSTASSAPSIRAKRSCTRYSKRSFLECPQGGKTAGRFRCVNKTGGPAYVDIRARACRGREAGPLDQVVIGFEPAGRRLEPQEAAIFSAVIDRQLRRNCQ